MVIMMVCSTVLDERSQRLHIEAQVRGRQRLDLLLRFLLDLLEALLRFCYLNFQDIRELGIDVLLRELRQRRHNAGDIAQGFRGVRFDFVDP